MKEEIWKPIKGYEGYYEVSSLGRAKSLERMRWNGRGSYISAGRILKPSKNTSRSTPYYYVGLSRGGKTTSVSLSVLVCTAFHGPRPDNIGGDTDVECMHLNGDSLDNRAENLRWGTHTENMNEKKCKLNHISSSRKKRTVIQQDLEGREVARFPSTREAARQTGLDYKHIAKCAAKKKYYRTHGGFRWEYLSDYGKEES